MKSNEDMTVHEKMVVVVSAFILGLEDESLRHMEAAADMANELSNDPEFRAMSIDALDRILDGEE